MNCSNFFRQIGSLISFPVTKSCCQQNTRRCTLEWSSILRIRSAKTSIGLVRIPVTLKRSQNTRHQKRLKFLHRGHGIDCQLGHSPASKGKILPAKNKLFDMVQDTTSYNFLCNFPVVNVMRNSKLEQECVKPLTRLIYLLQIHCPC